MADELANIKVKLVIDDGQIQQLQGQAPGGGTGTNVAAELRKLTKTMEPVGKLSLLQLGKLAGTAAAIVGAVAVGGAEISVEMDKWARERGYDPPRPGQTFKEKGEEEQAERERERGVRGRILGDDVLNPALKEVGRTTEDVTREMEGFGEALDQNAVKTRIMATEELILTTTKERNAALLRGDLFTYEVLNSKLDQLNGELAGYNEELDTGQRSISTDTKNRIKNAAAIERQARALERLRKMQGGRGYTVGDLRRTEVSGVSRAEETPLMWEEIGQEILGG